MLSNNSSKEKTGPKKNNVLVVPPVVVKKDFFGRVVVEKPLDGNGRGGPKRGSKAAKHAAEERSKVWVTFHEGLNNAVRKPLALEEFLRGL